MRAVTAAAIAGAHFFYIVISKKATSNQRNRIWNDWYYYCVSDFGSQRKWSFVSAPLTCSITNRVWTYLPQDAPNFHKGHSLNLAAAALAVTLVVLGAIYLRWENAKRDKGERNNRLRDGMSQEEIQNLGYRHPKFRYQI